MNDCFVDYIANPCFWLHCFELGFDGIFHLASELATLLQQQNTDINNQNMIFQASRSCVNYCFNPDCKTAFNRVFSEWSQHPGVEECSAWIINEDSHQAELDILREQFKRHDLGELKLDQLQFTTGSLIRSLVSSETFKAKALSKLTDYLKMMQQKVHRYFKAVEKTVKAQIEVYFEPFVIVDRDIQNFVKEVAADRSSNEVKSARINEIVNKTEFTKVKRAENMIFIPHNQAAELKIKESIMQFAESLVCTKDSLKPDLSISDFERNNLLSYLKDVSNDHNKKMTKLSTLLRTDQKKLYEKKSVGNGHEMSTKCPICSIVFSTQKRKELMLIWNSLSEHLFEAHLPQIGYNYQHLISGHACGKLSPHQIVSKLINYNYECVEFVTKSGRCNFNFHFENRHKLCVDVVAKGETHLPLPHIQVIEASDLFAIIVSIGLCLQFSSNPSARKKSIYIYISNMTEIYALRRLVDLFSLDNVKILSERRSQQSTIFYQDEDPSEQTNNDGFQNITRPKEQYE